MFMEDPQSVEALQLCIAIANLAHSVEARQDRVEEMPHMV